MKMGGHTAECNHGSLASLAKITENIIAAMQGKKVRHIIRSGKRNIYPSVNAGVRLMDKRATLYGAEIAFLQTLFPFLPIICIQPFKQFIGYRYDQLIRQQTFVVEIAA